MKTISIIVSTLLLLISHSVIAKDASINVGDFSYQDLTHIGNDSSVLNQIHRDEFVFFLKQMLVTQTDLNMVEKGFAAKTIIGRVTKINRAGDARVELGFSKQGRISLGIDDVPDMVALEVTLDDSEDAMISLVDQVKHMIVLSLAPDTMINTGEVVAAH